MLANKRNIRQFSIASNLEGIVHYMLVIDKFYFSYSFGMETFELLQTLKEITTWSNVCLSIHCEDILSQITCHLVSLNRYFASIHSIL